MSRKPKPTNNHGPQYWPAVVLIAGLFYGCTGDIKITCTAETTPNSANASCTDEIDAVLSP